MSTRLESIGQSRIEKIVDGLELDLETEVIPWNEEIFNFHF